MESKVLAVIFVTLFSVVEFSGASPTRRQYLAITEASASDAPVTNDDAAAWDDNDEFDLDGDGWFSQAVVSPSSAPQKKDFDEYDDDDYNRGSNVMVEFGGDEDEDEDDQHQQDAEEDEGSRNDSEFLFVPPKDTRLVLEDDDDDQSGPIKVRHTGRSSYPRVSDGGSDNSLESSDEDEKGGHPYEFTIDEDDKDDDDEEDEEDDHKEQDSEPLARHDDDDDDDDDEDEFVSEGDDMFDNPEEEAAQVIYGDHVFLY